MRMVKNAYAALYLNYNQFTWTYSVTIVDIASLELSKITYI